MRLLSFILSMMLVLVSVTLVHAQERITISVQTVLAGHESNYIDPKLGSLINELKPVFRYSSYRLIHQNRLVLRQGQTGTLQLPGERTMRITPNGVEGGRVRLHLSILKHRQQIFQTQIKLLNQRSLVVGGPKHGNGTLLFNILGSF